MRPALLAPAALLAATLCMSGAIAHSETADFNLSSEALGQVPIIRGLTDTEKVLLARSFGSETDRTFDNSSYAAAWRLSEWVEAFARELAAFWEPRLVGVLLWLCGLGLSLWRWSRPVSKAETKD